MALSSKQLTKLRSLAALDSELSAMSHAGSQERERQMELINELRRKRQRYEWERDATHQDDSREQLERQIAEADEAIAAARALLDGLQKRAAELNRYAAPLRELVDKVRRYGQLSREDLGVSS